MRRASGMCPFYCPASPVVAQPQQQRGIRGFAPRLRPVVPVHVELGGGGEPLDERNAQAAAGAQRHVIAVLQAPEAVLLDEGLGASLEDLPREAQAPAERRMLARGAGE